jgi:hypothetical protein
MTFHRRVGEEGKILVPASITDPLLTYKRQALI